MNKKKIINQTMMFIFAVIFIVAFKSIFGNENTLIGVTIMTASLMLLSRDLTLNPIKNLLILIGVNIFSGVLSYFADINVISGVICNFIAMFFIGYLFCSNLKAAIYIPFGLQYMFMLSVQVPLRELPNRLIALLVGAFIIMFFQLVFNKNKVQKVTKTTLSKICDLLYDKIEIVIKNGDLKDINNSIQKNINNIRECISDSKESHFYVTKEGRIALDISIALNRLNKILNNIKISKEYGKYKEFLIDLSKEIKNIKSSINDKNNIHNIKNSVDKIINKYKDFSVKDKDVYEAINVLNFLKENLNSIYNLDKKEKGSIYIGENIPENFKLKYLLKINFNKHSAKFCYAVRVSVVFTLAAFIVQYFKLGEGKWIYFTVYSLTQPYLEATKKKTVDRVKGTIIGVLVFLVLFTIIKDSTIRIVIVAVAGYIMGFIDKYDTKMILITISSLGVASVSGHVDALALYRFEYIVLGAIIAILGNNFVFPFKMKDGVKQLEKIYYGIVKEMINEIHSILIGKENKDYARNLLLISSQVDEKLLTINETYKNDKLSAYIENQRNMVEDLYCLFTSINQLSDNKNIKAIIEKYIRNIRQYIVENDEEEKDIDKFDLSMVDNIKDRLILINLFDIYEDIMNMKKLHIVN